MAVKEEVLGGVDRGYQDPQLRDLIVSKIVKMGRACANDLAGQIGTGIRPQQLVHELASLEELGVIRRSEKDRDDPRNYNASQTVYELTR
jgi:DNA-binding HxlR family transcriptional regulator